MIDLQKVFPSSNPEKLKKPKYHYMQAIPYYFLPGTECACYFSEIPNLLNFSKCEALKSDLLKIQMLCSSRTRI